MVIFSPRAFLQLFRGYLSEVSQIPSTKIAARLFSVGVRGYFSWLSVAIRGYPWLFFVFVAISNIPWLFFSWLFLPWLF